MTRSNPRYGYRPDLGDPRDHNYQATGAVLPPSVDLRSRLPAPWDQGQLGSCTAFGIGAVVCFLHGFVGSQLWLYYNERKIEGTIRQDAGAEIRDGIKVVSKLGLPLEAAWPYVISRFRKAPPAAANKAAKQELVSEYQRLNGATDYLDCLASDFPFVVGISVFESFESDAVASTGKVPMPAKNEQVIGGHCIAVVGYTPQHDFICRNSWGTGWGMTGHFILPNAYLASSDLATDAWVVKAAAQ
jgi:C1A family cysteine protease